MAMSLSSRLLSADELGIRLEIVNGLAIWEAQPPYRHQRHVERIARGIEALDVANGCACVHALDVYIALPNGLKRPDVSISCRESAESEQDRPLTPPAPSPGGGDRGGGSRLRGQGPGDRAALRSVPRGQGRDRLRSGDPVGAARAPWPREPGGLADGHRAPVRLSGQGLARRCHRGPALSGFVDRLREQSEEDIDLARQDRALLAARAVLATPPGSQGPDGRLGQPDRGGPGGPGHRLGVGDRGGAGARRGAARRTASSPSAIRRWRSREETTGARRLESARQ